MGNKRELDWDDGGENVQNDGAGKSITGKPYRIGRFDVFPNRHEIELNGQATKIEPRIMAVLNVLAGRPNEVVTRSELIDFVWNVEFGADESLTRAISVLRKIFREDGDTDYITTIPKRGYRLMETVLEGTDNRTQSPDTNVSAEKPKRIMWPALLVVAGLILGLFWIVNAGQNRPATEAPLTPDQIQRAAVNQSIAVLPFEAFSGEESDRYFGLGLAEELINQLAAIPDLSVTARTSSFSFVGSEADIVEIARKLSVAYILEGSVRRSGDRIRITAQLIDGGNGTHMWSQTFDEPYEDIFKIEDEIVSETSRILQAHLGVGIWKGRSSGEGVDPAAYQHFLEGLALWGLRMREDDTRGRALEKMKRAVELDPDFADAWAALGGFGVLSKGSPLARDIVQFNAMIENALLTALELDPDNANALSSLALKRLTSDMNLEDALHYHDRFEKVAPKQTGFYYHRAYFLEMLGDADGAEAAYNRAAELDPLNRSGLRSRASFLSTIGKHKEAMAFFNSCWDTQCLGEGFVAFASFAALMSKDPDEIERWKPRHAEFEAFINKLPPSRLPPVALVSTGIFAIEADEPDKTSEVSRLNDMFEKEIITDTMGMWAPTMAEVLSEDRFFEVLETAYGRGDFFGAANSTAPFYGQYNFPDWVLTHPRYHALWERPGLKEIAELRRENGAIYGLPIPP